MNIYTERQTPLPTTSNQASYIPCLPRVEISSSRKITLSIYGIRACAVYINLFFELTVNPLDSITPMCYNTKYRDGTEPSINKLQVGTPDGKVTGVRG